MSDNLPQQYPRYPHYSGAMVALPQAAPGSGMATTGMVLGIMAWVITLITFFLLSWIGAAMSIVGFIVSVVAYQKLTQFNAPKGQAIAGLIINGIAVIVTSAAFLLIITILGGTTGS